jgi:KaiC/GvpD/RAD55 family RecA-like ATPase
LSTETDAQEYEKQYKWLEAAEIYEQLASAQSATPAIAAETWRQAGFCYHLASRQTSDHDSFITLNEKAVASYSTAAFLFDQVKAPGKRALSTALAKYTSAWQAATHAAKVQLLEECYSSGVQALKAFGATGDEANYGIACSTLQRCAFERLKYARTGNEKRKIGEEGINFSDKAISAIRLSNKEALIPVYAVAALINWYTTNITEQDSERKEIAQRCVRYAEKALRLVKDVQNPYTTAMAQYAAAMTNLFFRERIEASLTYARDMRQQGLILKDNYIKGIASYLIAFASDWMIPKETDPDQKRARYDEIIQTAQEGIRYFQIIGHHLFIAETSEYYVSSYCALARDIEVDLEEKRALMAKASDIGHMGLDHAKRAGTPDGLNSTLHSLSKALQFQAQLEPERETKITLLEEALTHRQEHLQTMETLFPASNWVIGVSKYYAAQIQAQLYQLEPNETTKLQLLNHAISDMQDGVQRCNLWIAIQAAPSQFAIVGSYEDEFGSLYNNQYTLSKERDALTHAIQIFHNSSDKFKKVNMPSRAAEAYWKIARNHDLLGSYKEAAQSFEHAFAEYKAAIRRFEQFADFFQNYATYMRAWSEIEIAKAAHANQDYLTAMNNYENAAKLLRQSKMWNHVASNFLAWSYLEQAEDFSRKDNSKRAIDAFQNARSFFREAQKTLQGASHRITISDEKELAQRLIAASETRGGYCEGRIALEEAKILDGQGNHMASSAKYGVAANTFKKLSETASEETCTELRPMIYLCQAWQKMMMAEARTSPIMYEEAAELFEQAKNHTLTQVTSLLAQGHSSFCRALEAGTEFEITRDMMLYATAKKYTAAAANFYMQAGYTSASEYAKATQRLFDAYVYIDNAKKEFNPQDEAKHYMMAEKVLQVAAESFLKAKHPEKISQIQILLQNVREEKELALSLGEVLRAPTITSSTASFMTLTPHEETAAGLERFEQADIQAKLILTQPEIKLGENFTLEIQILNVGKKAIRLTQIENLLPPSLQVVENQTAFQISSGQVDLKGVLLEPLATQTIQLVLKSDEYGSYDLHPTIIAHARATGEQMIHELEPLTVTVIEAVLPGRMTTGYKDLDKLTLGGIPENYAVILTAPSYNERDKLINMFLDAGVTQGQITFYLTVQVSGVKALAEEYQRNFHLFVCNPRSDMMIDDMPNVYKLKGVENLTEIDIAVTKALRRLDKSIKGPKRACIDIVSDVLLQHHAVATRRWLTGLIPDLRARGFTTLAVMNPLMHPAEEVHAILGLFDGEITIYEKASDTGLEKFLQIRKMYNQRYVEQATSLKDLR